MAVGMVMNLKHPCERYRPPALRTAGPLVSPPSHSNMLLPRMRRGVVWYIRTYVSDELFTSTFTVDECRFILIVDIFLTY
jgi:hypothetical protein